MLKKMRKRAQNKKGFTLVELIVVIVIILILAAVLVPSLLKYVDKANKANCKADAATLLSQLQADYAAGLASGETGVNEITGSYTINNVTITNDGKADNKGEAGYTVKDGEITLFKYNNGKYIATWTMAANGTTVTKGGWEVTEVTGN